MSEVPQKMLANKIEMDQPDRSTKLYREIMRYIEHRIEADKEALCKDIEEPRTQALRGSISELRKLRSALDPKVLPTQQSRLVVTDDIRNQ